MKQIFKREPTLLLHFDGGCTCCARPSSSNDAGTEQYPTSRRPAVKQIFNREPTLLLQVLSAVLALLVTFGMTGLSAENAGAIVAVATAILAAINALVVRPVSPSVFSGIIAAGATLLATYGLELSQERIGLVQMAVTAVMALLVRTQVTPMVDQAPIAPAAGTVR